MDDTIYTDCGLRISQVLLHARVYSVGRSNFCVYMHVYTATHNLFDLNWVVGSHTPLTQTPSHFNQIAPPPSPFKERQQFYAFACTRTYMNLTWAHNTTIVFIRYYYYYYCIWTKFYMLQIVKPMRSCPLSLVLSFPFYYILFYLYTLITNKNSSIEI